MNAIFRMQIVVGILTSAWLLLIVLSEYGEFTAVPWFKPSVTNQHEGQPAKQHVCQPVNRHEGTPPNCDLQRGRLECHVPVLNGNIVFTNYTEFIGSLHLYCDAKRNLPSKLLDEFFKPLGHSLGHIYIHKCNFVKISKGAFRGLIQLLTLWIEGESYSQLGRMGLQILSSTMSIQKSRPATDTAICSHDNLVLPVGIFSDLDYLNSLRLNTMWLNSSVWQVVKSLSNLENLELCNNSITIIDINAINNLRQLKSLDLSNNYIQVILNGTFESLSLLWRLDLSRNKIKFIKRGTFEGLRQLTTLMLTGNIIHTLNMGIFNGLTGLRRLYLTGNNITTIESNIFESLTDVNILDLSGNNIDTLEMGTFNGPTGLDILNLSRNSIHTLDMDTFKDQSNLRTLGMSGNSISTLETDTFTGLGKISLLLLAQNRITTIRFDVLSRLTTLRTLDLSDNHINIFPKLPSSLKFLWLRNNEIVQIDTTLFARLTNLITLDLSHNFLREFTHYSIPNTIRTLNISSNAISVASFQLPVFLSYADLRNNEIKTLKVSGLQKYRDSYSTDSIYLAGNGDPFNCVCNLDVLNKGSIFNYDSYNVSQYRIWNFVSTNCSSESMFESREITEIPLATFNCHYYTSCPENCICYFWNYEENINIVDCLNAKLTSVPVNISVTCTVLDLSGNMFHSLVSGNFDGLSQLNELYLNASNITEISKGTFKNLLHLAKLDLCHNSIRYLNSGIFTGLKSLSSLYFSFNSIHVIEKNTFEALIRLRYLDLSRNKLETVSSSDIESMYTLKSLYLSYNPWSCNCTFLKKFIPLSTANSVQDQSDIFCFTSNKTKFDLVKIILSEFSPDSGTGSKKTNSMSAAEIALSVIMSVTFIGIIWFLLVFRNRKFLKLWFFIKFGWKSASVENQDMDRTYDAFVSYSNVDEAFVTGELIPRLQEPRNGRLGYNLCVHFRDFPVGGHIPETILGAVNNSRRVIMILSDNFLSSEWCNYEFQAAHHQLLTEWKNRIIMVLLHDLNRNLLDRQLKLYLRTRTYVKVGDPLFWDKIEYAMPERKLPNEENLNSDNINSQVDNMQAEGGERTSDDEQLLN